MGTIRLVPFGEEHDEAFTAMLADAEIARFTPLPQPVPPGFAATWRQRYDEHRPHRENFAVVDDDGRFLGIAVAPMVDREARTAELGYAVVPWLVLAGRRIREQGTVPTSVWFLMPLGSLSASAGVVSAAVLLVCGLTRARRTWVTLVALCLAVNAPWLVAGLVLTATTGRAAHQPA